MKKIDLGQTIAILANVGVIAGIVFLGLEIRQSTAVAQASSYQQSAAEIADVRMAIASDPELTRLYHLFQSDQLAGDLDDESKLRLRLLINNLLGASENAYFARQYGILGDSEWERMERAACTHFRRSNEIFEAVFISSEFSTHLASNC